MKRNVIKLGQSTLVVSLPSRWVEENGIKPRTELDVVEDGGSLHIHLDEQTRQEPALVLEFSAKDWAGPVPEKYVLRMLATAYKQGVSTITVKCKEKHIMDYIEGRVEGFIGLEIVEQRKDSLVLKSVVSGDEANFDAVLARAVNLTEHIASGTFDALSSNDRGEKANLLRLERTHNKVTDYLKRAIAIRRVSWEDRHLYSFVSEDERLVDEYKYILEASTKKLRPKTLQLLRRVNDYLFLLLDLYRELTPEKIARLSQDNALLRQQTKTLVAAGEDAVIAMHLYNIVVATYELGETVLTWKHR